jgi:SAM-dependent methyltransferase
LLGGWVEHGFEHAYATDDDADFEAEDVATPVEEPAASSEPVHASEVADTEPPVPPEHVHAESRGRRRTVADEAAAFDERAATYETHGHGRKWSGLVERTADVALSAMPIPLRVLDVGCGTGALLREIVVRVPYGELYVGIDPSQGMLEEARRTSDPRIRFIRGAAEALPFPDRYFDLVVTSASFHHWVDQRAGLEELARVVSDNGLVVLVDEAAGWLRQQGRARSPKSITRMLADVGLAVDRTETVYRAAYSVPLVRAFIAVP